MQDNTRTSFLKTYILPLFLIFLIPAFCYWFFSFALEERNEKITSSVISSIQTSESISPNNKAQFVDFYNSTLPSTICLGATLEHQQISKSMGGICDEFSHYDIGLRIILYSMLISVIVIFCIIGLFLLSFKSQTIQYSTFVVAWNISKLFCIIQVLAQGLLLVGISYFASILISNSYYPKLMIIIAMPIAYACFQMIVVLFKKLNAPSYISGRLLTENESPQLYTELKAICDKLKIEIPDNIVLGVEDNFFVTENELILNGEKELTGKTLYASIFHLKKLDKEEASAIFAHEMAHFSGEDTFFSKKTMPMLATCDSYLIILNETFITWPAFYFLLFFRSIFEISFGKVSRRREFRADSIAVEHVGAKALSNGLVKFVFYSEYRASLETSLFSKNEKIESINFIDKINEGVPSFAKEYKFDGGILDQVIAHPFDSHPPISKRIKAVGHSLNTESLRTDVLTNEEESWYHEIKDAKAIETELMQEFEDSFLAFHEENLAYHFLPSNSQETAVVEKLFPPINIKSKNEKENLQFNTKTFKYSKWDRDIAYDEVELYVFQEIPFIKKKLTFRLKKNADFPGEKRRVSFPIKSFVLSEEEVFEKFLIYSSRYVTALEFQSEQKPTN
jgi:Zn-dependent protease with chaperone function